ncbi:MAG: ABC transporter substrate-binding protein [Alphaproteobacteria bacterium]
MTGSLHTVLMGVVIALAAIVADTGPATGQKRGGVLRMYSPDSPASMSILEEAHVFTQGPMMGVFNNLVMIDQRAGQSRLDAIVPDLATEWAWNEDGTALTFKLRQGVRWHDGRPFTAGDVLCTWDLLLEKAPEKLRANPLRTVYDNLDRVSADGEYEVTFHVKRPQPGLPMQLAGGFAAIYPCHVPPARMRTHPIGTGPFKFVEYKPNEHIKVARNPEYWKPDRPYLDGIEYPIIRNPATAVLAFVSGKVDMTFPNQLTMPLLKDVKNQVPGAICEIKPDGGVNRHLIIHREKPPFDNPGLRRAMALAIDRKAFVDILSEGQGDIGGVLQPPPGGLWGMPPERLRELPGYDPDVQRNRAEARRIMEKLGYGPNNRLRIKLSTRDIRPYRDPAVLLIDQLKQVYIDAELDPVETAVYFPKIRRRDFTVGLNAQTSGPDPDPILALFYGCGSSLNWDGYCNPEIDRLIELQSIEADANKRKELLWEIERRLAEDGARPIIFYNRAATCWQPYVKGVTLMDNSIFDPNRREDWWLDK